VDEVGEEIDVEDLWEELGGGQMEPVRSQVRKESSEGGSKNEEVKTQKSMMKESKFGVSQMRC
jgi:hypothetical protein